MVFFTLWLQLLGFTDYSASVLMALFAGGCAVGSALGGYLGDPKGIPCMQNKCACKTSVHARQVCIHDKYVCKTTMHAIQVCMQDKCIESTPGQPCIRLGFSLNCRQKA